MMIEVPAARLKRLRMRAWRRGTKEMDLILGPYADERLATMDAQTIDAFDDLLSQNDHDLYAWITGALPAPAAAGSLIADIADHAGARLRAGI